MTLLLHLEAPLMSFGKPLVNSIGRNYPAPTLSMLTGLIGNAMGLEHREPERLDALQRSLTYTARREREGVVVSDYQTVDLGQSFLCNTGWTTRGAVEERKGGNSTGTHIRERDYFADALFVVAVSVAEDRGFDENLIAEALRKPQHPLFLGRKNCLPSRPILTGIRTESNVWKVISEEPMLGPASENRTAWGPTEGAPSSIHIEAWYDTRDWFNGVHTGKRLVSRAVVTPPLRARKTP